MCSRRDAGPSRVWSVRWAMLLVAVVLLMFCCAQRAHAGGPRWVAGSSYFNAAAEGQPVVWAGGQVKIFTDLALTSQANGWFNTVMTAWNSVPTAAVALKWGGRLKEVVDSATTTGANGVVLPADIQPTATSKPVALVYDETGAVINGLYGAGANSSLNCQANGVIARVDNIAVTGNIAHALIIVNGQCANTAAQITDLEYQLMRAFGYVLGLGWSQTNEEMFVGNQITAAGLAGWPIMHPMERLCNGSGGKCMPNGLTPRTDDIAALNRLYPVTAANIGNFTGKTITAAATISVQGTITFPGGQGMQGVNVVLRPLLNGVPDIRYTATAVSGVYFQGDVGNRIDGTSDASGNPLNRFGSSDATLEGFFDLSGVPLPPGVTTSDYQLTFEAVNPLYTGSESVGPYMTGQVTPSGTMPVITLAALSAGAAVMEPVTIGDAADAGESGPDGTETAPATVPVNGEWSGRITGYGHMGWFGFWARSGRVFTVEAQALDESGAVTEAKAQMVIGAWEGSDPVGAAVVTGTGQAFNGAAPGLTTLSPVLMSGADSEVRIGLADARGDGRPDYAYHGRVLYAANAAPAHVPVSGGQVVIQGMGFRPGITVTVNGLAAAVSSITPNEIVAEAPASGGATGDVPLVIEDPQTLGIAAIEAGFSYDAGSNDALKVVSAPPSAAPIGVPEVFAVRVLNASSLQPVAGATVTFAVTLGTAMLECGQTSCSVSTAGDGSASIVVAANTAALAQVTASLANGTSVIAEFTGAAPPAIAALTPSLFIAMGSTVRWPVQAMVLNGSGAPASGQTVAWASGGSGVSVAAPQSAAAANGIATNTLTAGPFTSSTALTATACVAGTGSCAGLNVISVQPSTEMLLAWSGEVQYIAASESFAPVVLHVIDAFGDPVAGATVAFSEAYYGWTQPCPAGEACAPAPLLAEGTAQAVSGLDGSVTLTPLTTNGEAGRLEVLAVTGTNTTLEFELNAHP